MSNVEGILQRTITALEQDQPVRIHQDPEGAAKVEEYVAKIKDILEVKIPFHIVSETARDLGFKIKLLLLAKFGTVTEISLVGKQTPYILEAIRRFFW